MALGSAGRRYLARVKVPWTWERMTLYGGCRSIPGRSGKSCRLRWGNRLSPGRPFTAEEDETILHAHARFGNEWAVIALLLSGRTGNAVKNHWNLSLKWKLSNAASYNDAYDPLPKRSTTGPPASDVSIACHHSEIFPTPRGSAGFIPTLVDLSSLIEGGGKKRSCPATTLSLSPPGHLEELPCENGDPAPGGDIAKPVPCLVPRGGEPQQQSPRDAELRALVRELIRKEVRNYISEP
ncbi:unnamed protein product [Spirodela intermedia]|uniref:Uncharacterized protein n=1 Tax=Spirodela intermedia TaxID=51605 RepID=A0A7I8IUA9_SPIIN|nr:unnamed protein product [Spirodela intermedia]CAA6661408.1 unnamed protein product [Spirodela intermedia]